MQASFSRQIQQSCKNHNQAEMSGFLLRLPSYVKCQGKKTEKHILLRLLIESEQIVQCDVFIAVARFRILLMN